MKGHRHAEHTGVAKHKCDEADKTFSFIKIELSAARDQIFKRPDR